MEDDNSMFLMSNLLYCIYHIHFFNQMLLRAASRRCTGMGKYILRNAINNHRKHQCEAHSEYILVRMKYLKGCLGGYLGRGRTVRGFPGQELSCCLFDFDSRFACNCFPADVNRRKG